MSLCFLRLVEIKFTLPTHHRQNPRRGDVGGDTLAAVSKEKHKAPLTSAAKQRIFAKDDLMMERDSLALMDRVEWLAAKQYQSTKHNDQKTRTDDEEMLCACPFLTANPEGAVAHATNSGSIDLKMKILQIFAKKTNSSFA